MSARPCRTGSPSAILQPGLALIAGSRGGDVGAASTPAPRQCRPYLFIVQGQIVSGERGQGKRQAIASMPLNAMGCGIFAAFQSCLTPFPAGSTRRGTAGQTGRGAGPTNRLIFRWKSPNPLPRHQQPYVIGRIGKGMVPLQIPPRSPQIAEIDRMNEALRSIHHTQVRGRIGVIGYTPHYERLTALVMGSLVANLIVAMATTRRGARAHGR